MPAVPEGWAQRRDPSVRSPATHVPRRHRACHGLTVPGWEPQGSSCRPPHQIQRWARGAPPGGTTTTQTADRLRRVSFEVDVRMDVPDRARGDGQREECVPMAADPGLRCGREAVCYVCAGKPAAGIGGERFRGAPNRDRDAASEVPSNRCRDRPPHATPGPCGWCRATRRGAPAWTECAPISGRDRCTPAPTSSGPVCSVCPAHRGVLSSGGRTAGPETAGG